MSANSNTKFHIDERVQIGKDVELGDSSMVFGPDTTIEDQVTIGERTILLGPEFEQKYRSGTLIKKGVKIGQACLIKYGITIGAGAVVRSGALVDRNVPPNVIVSGNPSIIEGYVATELVGNPGTTQPDQSGDPHLIHLPIFSDLRGELAVAETEKEIPFKIERVFFVYQVPSAELRGEHAHRNCHQVLICLRGSVNVVTDDATIRKEYVLDCPSKGLHLPPMTWGVQYNYSPDAILLVLASHKYDAIDYIRNYDEYLKEKRLNNSKRSTNQPLS